MSWTRVAHGLRIVATDGASRITNALLSTDPQSAASSVPRHLPEVASSVLRQFKRSNDIATAVQRSDDIKSNAVKMKEDLMRNDKSVDEPSTNELQAVGTTTAENDGSSSIAATSNNSAINITSQQIKLIDLPHCADSKFMTAPDDAFLPALLALIRRAVSLSLQGNNTSSLLILV
eukprot:scaffold11362_cov37-Cyclotella_meneghiniana.AAC.1